MAESPDNVPTILDYLNEDCWRAILDYVPVQDIIRTECTSRRWQDVVLTYLRSVRIVINNSLHGRVTTEHRHARQLKLQPCDAHLTSFETWTTKLGPSVVSAHCSRNRTLKLIKENCPNLEYITFYNLKDVMDENGSFKWLRRICFRNCSIPVDYCISQLMCNDTLEELKIISSRFTGQCINTQWTKLKTLILIGNLEELQSRHLLAATCLGQLTSFEVRDLRITKNKKICEEIHLFLDKMPNLERLYIQAFKRSNNTLIESISRLRNLKNLQTDFVVTDEDLEAVTRQCQELKILRLRRSHNVTGRGVAALCRNAGARLTVLSLRYCHQLMDDDVAIICSCPKLEVLVLHKCEEVTSAVLPRAASARRALGVRSPLHLALDRDFARLRKEEYKELEFHNFFDPDCTKCRYRHEF